jgi:hypothetical protein
MGRAARQPLPIGGCALFALLAACYAVPERHSVNSEVTGGDGGSEGPLDADVELDAEAVERGDGGKRDAATNACGCDDLSKPICIEATKTCVACTADAGICGANQLCDVLQGACVECLSSADCKDPGASACDLASHTCKGCKETSDCSHIDGKQVCLTSTSTCVQCTKDKLAACLVQQSPTRTVQNACNALNHTCTDEELGKTPPCGECVSDAQCTPGHVCVDMAFGGQPIIGKWYCQPVRDGMNCDSKRPYVVLASGNVTIEGENADFCTLQVSSCSAQSHYLTKFCGLDRDDRPVALDDAGEPLAPSVKGDNALCGLPGLEDGYCVEAQPGLFRCTVSCGYVKDCPVVASACVQQQAHATGTADLCKVL